MRVEWTGKRIETCGAALVVVLVREDGANRAFDDLDRLCGGALGAQASEESFKGQDGRLLEWRGDLRRRTCRVVAIGLGTRSADAASRKGPACTLISLPTVSRSMPGSRSPNRALTRVLSSSAAAVVDKAASCR